MSTAPDYQEFSERVKRATSQLDPYPWNKAPGYEQTIEGLCFRVCYRKSPDGKPLQGWSLIDASGNMLGIDAWYCELGQIPVIEQDLKNSTYVPPEFEPELKEDFEITETPLESQAVPVPVMIVDESEDVQADEKQQQVSAAFAAEPFFWKSKPLAAFAIDREADWMRHRELLEEAPLQELIRLPFAMLLDALRVLWFLSHDPSVWLNEPSMKEVETDDGAMRWIRLTGKERALSIEAKIRAWSAENVSHNEASTAVALFYDIYNRAQSTRAIAKPGERHDANRAKN